NVEPTNGSGPKEPGKEGETEEAKADGPEVRPPPMRAVVFADADLAGNLILRNQGNLLLVLDALSWLSGDEAITGTVESEADVRITHRKDEDRIWFYGSSMLVPASVLAVGLLYTRRSRRGGREATQREG